MQTGKYLENLYTVLRILLWYTHRLSLFFTSPYFLSVQTDQNFSNLTSFTWKLKDQIQDYIYKDESPGMRRWNLQLVCLSPTLVDFQYLLMLFPLRKNSDPVCHTSSAPFKAPHHHHKHHRVPTRPPWPKDIFINRE